MVPAQHKPPKTERTDSAAVPPAAETDVSPPEKKAGLAGGKAADLALLVWLAGFLFLLVQLILDLVTGWLRG